MNRLLLPLLVAGALLLAGCASNKPATPPAAPPPDPTPVKVQEASPKERAAIRTDLAAGYYERGQMDVALEELGAAKVLNPSYPKLYNIYGLVYAMLGERAKAEENFRQAVKGFRIGTRKYPGLEKVIEDLQYSVQHDYWTTTADIHREKGRKPIEIFEEL